MITMIMIMMNCSMLLFTSQNSQSHFLPAKVIAWSPHHPKSCHATNKIQNWIKMDPQNVNMQL